MHVHAHGGRGEPLAPTERRRLHVILASIVVPLFLATLVGLVALYPHGETKVGSVPYIAPGMESARVRVVDTPVDQCALEGAASLSSDLLDSAVCAEVLDGKGQGLVVPVHVAVEYTSIVGPGTVIKVIYDPDQIASGTPYLFWDIERTTPMAVLGAIYVILVIAVAGRRGVFALVGLLASTVILVGFVVPALMAGTSPMLVTIVGAAAMLFVSVYMAHGVTIRTTTALLGTLVGLGVTVTMGLWGVRAATLSGATSEDAQTLFGYFPNLSLSALLTCGIVIAALGALNDVTITQASAVWELYAADPHMGRWRLFSRAMRIGSDHIASTVYTLAFAYAGTALPTLILALMIDRPPGSLLVAGDIAEEVVRTLVASIGLILAIPMTTAVGTFLAVAVGVKEGTERSWITRSVRTHEPLAADESMWDTPDERE